MIQSYRYITCAYILFCCTSFALGAAPANTITLNEIEVSGIGWKTNRQLKKALSLTMADTTNSAKYGTAFFEDAFWVLEDGVRSKGYLKPQFSVKIQSPSDPTIELMWTKESALSSTPPEVVAIDEIKFIIKPGTLYYYDSLSVNGLEEISQSISVTSFFYPSDQWFSTRKNRAFTPARLQ